MFLQVFYKRRAAGPHGGGIAGLCFAVLMNIGRGKIQMRGPKAGQKLYVLVIGMPQAGVTGFVVYNVSRQ